MLRALDAPAGAEPERRCGLYAPLDLPALVARLHDGQAFAYEFGRFIAISPALIGWRDLLAGERRARDAGHHVKTRLVDEAGHFFLLPAWVG
ncbi:MAG: hypothetical protein MUF34_24415 [Polyangiaceae bacterium]|nr:hypothetical protein [Polyangiaceae bacterium]